MTYRVAASYWTIGLVAVAIVAGHAWWFYQSCHAGEVLSGLGAAVILLGIWIAARPYIRRGLEATVIASLPPGVGGYTVSTEKRRAARERREAERPAVVRDVRDERMFAVVVIGFGTILNGYGTPIARVFGLRI